MLMRTLRMPALATDASLGQLIVITTLTLIALASHARISEPSLKLIFKDELENQCSRGMNSSATSGASLKPRLAEPRVEPAKVHLSGAQEEEPSLRVRDPKAFLKPLYNEANFEVVSVMYQGADSWQGRFRPSDLARMGMLSKYHTSTYSDNFIHKYDDFRELVQSNWQANNEKCVKYLEELIPRAKSLIGDPFNNNDVETSRLFDTWGRAPSGIYLGNFNWPGLYDECLKLKIHTSEGPVGTRYCVLSMNSKDAPRNALEDDLLHFKVGVCLPRLCDSLSYKDKLELILQLAEQNMAFGKNSTVPLNLYCLPDEASPLRQWYKRPASLATALGITSWLLLVALATYKWERHRRTTLKQASGDGKTTETGSDASRVLSPDAPALSLSSGFQMKSKVKSDLSSDGKPPEAIGKTFGADKNLLKVYRCLAVTHNFECLINTSKNSSLMETGSKLESQPAKPDFGDGQKQLERQLKSIVDLRVVEGIKVVSLCYVLMGHALMCISMGLENGRDVALYTWSPAFFLANLVPAFAVNAFFSITGLLTAYLLFKQNQSFTMISSPSKWLALTIYRYLRIMPMYILAVLYGKYLAKFASRGPLWDYGTSVLGSRRQCEQESWLWTLLFVANFKPPLEHCIPSAWYLANDFQFSLVTPIFLALLHKRPKLGRLTLMIAIAAGSLANFFSIILVDFDDLRPVARFMPHGFKTYVTSLSANYTQPQYRIAAYLVGLLIGHSLFTYEQSKRNFLIEQHRKQAQKSKPQTGSCDDLDEELDREVSSVLAGETGYNASKVDEPISSEDLTKLNEMRNEELEVGWSNFFTNYGLLLSQLFVFICVVTPMIGAALPFNKAAAKFMVAIIMPSYHVLFALSVGFSILLFASGHGNKLLGDFLSASIWKPLARLSLCAMLFNVDVTNYLVQSSSHTNQFGNVYLVSLILTSTCMTFVVALITCVLFEAPIRSILNLMVSMAVKRISSRRTSNKKSN